jgi:hypothetical protein
MKGVTRKVPILLVAALLAGVGSCGGGGSNDGGGDVPDESTTGLLSAGVISGFGSVYINGVRYGTDATSVLIDDQEATVAQLEVGQYVELKGHEHSYRDGKDCEAEIIRYHNVLEGPVTSIDLAGDSFVAMGQVVQVTLDTVVGDGIEPASVEGLAVGDVVEVSGIVPQSGAIDATRIDIQPDGGPYDVTGYASNVQADAGRFAINELVVDYNGANMEDFPGGDPATGDLVLVKGFTFDPDGTFVATRVELRSDDWLEPGAGDAVEIQGAVVDFASPTDFSAGGWHVTTTSVTTYEHGTAGDLSDGVMLRVKGTADAAGTLVASEISFMQVSDVRVVAQIADLDATARTLAVLGLEVSTDDSTHFEDMSLLHMREFGFGDLTVGAWADIRGYEEPEGSGVLRATRVVRIEAADTVRIRGAFREAVQPGFRILTVPVRTTQATRFVLEGNVRLTLQEFFEQAPGQIVEAWGAWSSPALVAERVEVKVSGQ